MRLCIQALSTIISKSIKDQMDKKILSGTIRKAE